MRKLKSVMLRGKIDYTIYKIGDRVSVGVRKSIDRHIGDRTVNVIHRQILSDIEDKIRKDLK